MQRTMLTKNKLKSIDYKDTQDRIYNDKSLERK